MGDRDMERSDLIKGLREIDLANPLGKELFEAIAPLVVSVAVEAVCLRKNSKANCIEVLLTKRSLTDSYPGCWHVPGSVMRSREAIEDVFNRLAEQEFGASISKTQFVCNVNLNDEPLGHFFCQVYLCWLLPADGTLGEWFSIDRLPIKIVASHRKRIIPAASGIFIAEYT